jgi:hypothetical protein
VTRKARTTRDRLERIHPYLGPDLRARLAKHCLATQTSESAVVRAALEQYLDGTGDFALFLRRLDRNARAHERTLRDLPLRQNSCPVLELAQEPRMRGSQGAP